MPIWMIRADQGLNDEREVISSGRVVIDPGGVASLAAFQNKAALRERYEASLPESEAAAQANQAWRFVHKVQRNDSVLLPIDDGRAYLLGSIESAYRYFGEAVPEGQRHAREVFWRSPALAAAELPAELLASFAAEGWLIPVAPRAAEDAVFALFERLTQTGWVKDGFAPA